jgi:phage recombination protein Bet
MSAVVKLNNQLPAMQMSEAELMTVLRNSLYVGAKDESIKMAVNYCKAAGLDIMQKPVHLVPMWDSKSGEMRDVVMPAIGLYRTQASRSGDMAGITEPEFGEDITFTFEGEEYWDKYDKKNKKRESVTVTYPKWCKVTVKKLMQNGMIAEYHAKELWLENYATASKDSAQPNSMWKKRPYAQLAKCAEAQALRKAFPELGSMPTAEEMEGKEIDVTAESTRETKAPEPPPKRYFTDEEFKAVEPKFLNYVKGDKPMDEIYIFIEAKGTFLTDAQKKLMESWRTPIEGEVIPQDDEFLKGYEQGESNANS